MTMLFLKPLSWCYPATTALVLLVGASSCAQAAQPAQPALRPFGYTLVVNLTPAMCALNPAFKRFRQCQEGFSLTISSLQPQLPKGKSAENCSQADANLPPLQERIVERVMPDEQLRNADWQRIGSCTGMSARTYFRTIASFADRLRVPAEFSAEGQLVLDRQKLINQLIELNSGLQPDGIQLRCASSGRNDSPVLTELHICYNLKGQYARCSDSMTSHCPTRFLLQGTP